MDFQNKETKIMFFICKFCWKVSVFNEAPFHEGEWTVCPYCLSKGLTQFEDGDTVAIKFYPDSKWLLEKKEIK